MEKIEKYFYIGLLVIIIVGSYCFTSFLLEAEKTARSEAIITIGKSYAK